MKPEGSPDEWCDGHWRGVESDPYVLRCDGCGWWMVNVQGHMIDVHAEHARNAWEARLLGEAAFVIRAEFRRIEEGGSATRTEET